MEIDRLKAQKQEVVQKIQLQVEKGKTLLKFFEVFFVVDRDDYQKAENERKKWYSFTQTMLSAFFDGNNFLNEFIFEFCPHAALSDLRDSEQFDELEFHKKFLTQKISVLDSIMERTSLIEAESAARASKAKKKSDDKIFIVHGRNEEFKEKVARFISKLGLTPVILHEMPNKGRSVLDKFEDHSSVGFAVVLLTADDMGYLKEDSKNPKLRARQNVIFELGFFISELGKSRVAAILEKGVEIPTDYSVVYISMEQHWQIDLAKELKEAGFSIDMNKII